MPKRIVKKSSGETYEIDTTNIGGARSVYVPIWKLETAIRQWLGETIEDLAEQIQVLAGIKDKTPEGQQYLSRLLSADNLPSPTRKVDVIQACHNVLAQLRTHPPLSHPNSDILNAR